MTDFFGLLRHCTLCPRKCGVNRREGERGYCNSGDGYEIAAICIHRGEEPAISGEKGICNVFFSHCNIQCVFCQNAQISDNSRPSDMLFTLNEVTEQIVKILEKGINSLGFVSPTHFLPQAIAITEAVRSKGHSPVTVWNSNGYELPECLELLDPYVDIFLPDFKYSDERVSEKYSDAPAYPQIALAALKKMQEMRGTRLLLDDNGQGYRGMLIRHLVLPGSSDQSCGVLRTIAEDLSLKIPVSLMSQYHPCHRAAAFPEINRTVGLAEYRLVKNEMQKLGLAGWVQEPESAGYYLPDFHSNNPFAE